MMVAEKLREESDAISAEGWHWVETAPDFPYGHNYGLRQLRGQQELLTPEREVTREALAQELAQIEQEHSGGDDLPDEVDQRLAEIEAALEELNHRPIGFAPEKVARAGAFVSIAPDGSLRVERGFVRPEDELPVAQEPGAEVATGERVAHNDDGGPADADLSYVSAPVPEPE